MPLDPFAHSQSGLQSPALHIEAITPSDSTDLARATRALNVAQGGTVRVVTLAGVTGDVHIAVGVAFPIRVRRVMATGIVGLS